MFERRKHNIYWFYNTPYNYVLGYLRGEEKIGLRLGSDPKVGRVSHLSSQITTIFLTLGLFAF